ncbi:uncharacterized protein LW93_4273 [Fusarium fujikuroi]|nr:uncharacterized protein LW93_4273 [Fusarium fujikuroi]
MSSAITTSLLMLEYTGTPNLVAEVIGANHTATTFVLDCDKPKHKKIWEDGECYITKNTVVLGPWADMTPAPGVVTTGIRREGTVDEDEKEGYSFSIECQMDCTMSILCNTTNHAPFTFFDGRGVTATYTKHGDVDGFFYGEYGYFGWAPVTVTAGRSIFSLPRLLLSPRRPQLQVSLKPARLGKQRHRTSSNSAGTRLGLTLWAAVVFAATLVLL